MSRPRCPGLPILAVITGSLLIGCGPAIKTLKLSDGVTALEEEASETPAPLPETRAAVAVVIEVAALDRVVATGRTGGLEREYRESYPFVAPDYDGNPPEVVADRTTRVKPTGLNMAMVEFAPTVVDIIRKRLAERFRAVDVKLALKHQRPDAIRVEPAIEIRWPAWGTIVGLAKLTASTSNGARIEVTAESAPRYTGRHLGWGLPLTILTFPLGLAITMVVLDGIKDDFYVLCVAEALDRAAEKLAARLAQPTSEDK